MGLPAALLEHIFKCSYHELPRSHVGKLQLSLEQQSPRPPGTERVLEKILNQKAIAADTATATATASSFSVSKLTAGQNQTGAESYP